MKKRLCFSMKGLIKYTYFRDRFLGKFMLCIFSSFYTGSFFVNYSFLFFIFFDKKYLEFFIIFIEKITFNTNLNPFKIVLMTNNKE